MHGEFAVNAVAQKKFKPSVLHAHLLADAKLPINWRDARQRQAALTPTDKRLQDHNIYCYRRNGKLYAVVSSNKWRELREKGKLNSFLDKQRKSDVVIKHDQGQ